MLSEINFDIKIIANNYVSNIVSLLQFIFFSLEGNNIQHSMLDNPDNNNISIHNYDKDWLPTFML